MNGATNIKLCPLEMQTHGSVNRRTLGGSTLEGSVIGFDMGIITDDIREINRWRR